MQSSLLTFAKRYMPLLLVCVCLMLSACGGDESNAGGGDTDSRSGRDDINTASERMDGETAVLFRFAVDKPAGSVINIADLEPFEVSIEYARTTGMGGVGEVGFEPGTPADGLGLRVLRDIEAGELLHIDQYVNDQAHLDHDTDQIRYAVRVNVQEQHESLRDSRVDLLVVNQRGEVHPDPVVENALVMSNGHVLIDTSVGRGQRHYDVVTLDLPLDQAERLIAIRERLNQSERRFMVVPRPGRESSANEDVGEAVFNTEVIEDLELGDE